jgi:glycerol uptake facilitator protein
MWIGFFVFVCILGLGGPTGIAANPARDFGPRLAHALLPIPGAWSAPRDVQCALAAVPSHCSPRGCVYAALAQLPTIGGCPPCCPAPAPAGKGPSEWHYSWVPFFATFAGGAIAGGFYLAVQLMNHSVVPRG